ncbi:TolC family protein, partial [Staphylococcus aureus]
LDMRLEIDRAITQSWNDLETAVAQITTRDSQIKAAEAALDGVTQEQQSGTRTVLDVLDAPQELFAARINLVHAQRDRIVAAYNLAQTLGQ